MTALRSGSATDVGRVRQNNEDAFLVADDTFAVADGMGGHRGGEVASDTALDAFRQAFVDRTVEGLRDAIESANMAVFERAEGDPDLAGMGTTLCVLAPIEDGEGEVLGIANVGDSRVYRLTTTGDLEQITEDHSLVAEMERDGRLTAEEAASHPKRNIVTRALGIGPAVDVDIFTVTPFEGDRYILCSDGLFDSIDESRIASTLRRLADPDETARELVRQANEGGGRDNITVVVVDVVDDDERAARASAALAGDPDLAGFTTAPTADAAATATHRKVTPAGTGRGDEAAGRRPAAARTRRRFLTWRVAVFLLLFLAVVGAGAGAVWYQARSTYYVGFADNDVAIFRGKPGGVLWIDPTLEDRTDIQRTEVPPADRPELVNGIEFGSLGEAERYVGNLQDDIEELRPTTTTTSSTTTTVPVTTATAPPVPAN